MVWNVEGSEGSDWSASCWRMCGGLREGAREGMRGLWVGVWGWDFGPLMKAILLRSASLPDSKSQLRLLRYNNTLPSSVAIDPLDPLPLMKAILASFCQSTRLKITAPTIEVQQHPEARPHHNPPTPKPSPSLPPTWKVRLTPTVIPMTQNATRFIQATNPCFPIPLNTPAIEVWNPSRSWNAALMGAINDSKCTTSGSSDIKYPIDFLKVTKHAAMVVMKHRVRAVVIADDNLAFSG
eukprot:CAMPEP_0184326002 /NCGR_PEP_ID=MMETSP1049-20130417/142332_1 /TAXON_ID=77928 /ORGANISM="Proteomonas sulcata, Strain CCMP704" /LENGTH=237 /DNA_ID=CAMNT_0026648171 /DNA_START=168 /DNA_END=882 /DNA_ORIENTATION=+